MCFGDSLRKNRVNKESMNILSLPVELLVYIISFLPTVRDKVKLRYVSRRLRVVSETPSLWRKFVWPCYDRREERCVMNVLKACGVHIKILVFPDHVTPSRILIRYVLGTVFFRLLAKIKTQTWSNTWYIIQTSKAYTACSIPAILENVLIIRNGRLFTLNAC